jgi:hypothetical protein
MQVKDITRDKNVVRPSSSASPQFLLLSLTLFGNNTSHSDHASFVKSRTLHMSIVRTLSWPKGCLLDKSQFLINM